jgi:hypothetical protein
MDLHFEATVEVLRELDADVVNLLEVQDCGALQRLTELAPELEYNFYMIQGMHGHASLL